jgi:NADPH:quinone reductase-like Zn-dependent oxidoreductase
MRAVIQEGYGEPDVLELREVEKPVVTGDRALVRVRAAGVDPGVWYYVIGTPYLIRPAAGMFRPRQRTPGRDMAGTVEAVGPDVTQFRPGDEVFGEINGGAYAEYASVPQGSIERKPANLTFEEAAAVSISATTALQGLRDKGRVRPGQKVLVNGASGGVGTFAVQIAKVLGAEVTGVCSTRNLDLVRSIGADHVVDYTVERFTESGNRYDVIFDLIANHPLSAFRRSLTPRGTLVPSSGRGGRWLGPIGRILGAIVRSPFVSQTMVPLVAKQTKEDLVALRELIEAGKVRPVIDRRYPLSEVAEALQYQGAGHTRGKTVLTI